MSTAFLKKIWCWKLNNINYDFVYVQLVCCLLSSLFLLSESRLAVVKPQSFSNYPVTETHFAPWSPNFTEIDGYIQYFPNRCNFSTGNISDIPLFPIPGGSIGNQFNLLVLDFIRNFGSKANGMFKSMSDAPTVYTKNLKAAIIPYVTYNSNVDKKNSSKRQLFGMLNNEIQPEINNLVYGPAPRELYIWLFDQCNNPEDVQSIIKLGNEKKALALAFTDTNFTEDKVWWNKWFPPTPLMPVFSVSGSLIKEIKSKLLKGVDVEACVDVKPVMYLDCSKVVYKKWTSFILSIVWTTVAVIWFLLTNVFRCRIAANLMHRFMLNPCLLKALFDVVAFVFLDLCPDYESDYVQYLLMLYMGLNTVFNTFFYGILLLLSKGYRVTRESFDRRKSISIALLVSLVYIITSVNQVDPVGTLPAVMALLVILMVAMLQGTNRNIHYLQVRLQYIRAAGIDGFDEAMLIKLSMFKTYKALLAIYFILQLFCNCWIWFFIDSADLPLAIQMVLELLLYVSALIIFRPRERVSYFSLMQDQDNAFNILPMYSAEPLMSLNVQSEDRINRVAPVNSSNLWYQNILEERPVVILNPSSGGAASPGSDMYANLAVGTPVLTCGYPTNYFQRTDYGERTRQETGTSTRGLDPRPRNNGAAEEMQTESQGNIVFQRDSQHFTMHPRFNEESNSCLNYENISSSYECRSACQNDGMLHECKQCCTMEDDSDHNMNNCNAQNRRKNTPYEQLKNCTNEYMFR